MRRTHHPDHHIGEDSDPNSGEEEGEHEELLPARLSTVRNREEQYQQQGPGDQPLQLVADARCTRHRGEIQSSKFVDGLSLSMPFNSK